MSQVITSEMRSMNSRGRAPCMHIFAIQALIRGSFDCPPSLDAVVQMMEHNPQRYYEYPGGRWWGLTYQYRYSRGEWAEWGSQ